MRSSTANEVSRPDAATDRRLAFAVFAPPIAWFVHEIVGVAVVGRECDKSDVLAAWQWSTLIAVSLAAAAVAIVGLFASLRIFHRWTGGAPLRRAEGRRRVEFVALLGVFLSALLLLNIIYFGVMPFVVQPCLRAL